MGIVFSLQIHHAPSWPQNLATLLYLLEITSFPCSFTYFLRNLQFCSCHLHREEICVPLQNLSLLSRLSLFWQGPIDGLVCTVVPSKHLFSQLPAFNDTAGLQRSSWESRPPVRKAAPAAQTLCPQVLITPLPLAALGLRWKCPTLAPFPHTFVNSCFVILSSNYPIWPCPMSLSALLLWSCPCFFLQHDLLKPLPSSQCIGMQCILLQHFGLFTATQMYPSCTQIFLLIIHLPQYPPHSSEASYIWKLWHHQPAIFWFASA